MQGRKYKTLLILFGCMYFFKIVANTPATNQKPLMTPINNPANVAENNNEIEYLKKYKNLQQLPAGAVPIQMCGIDEKKRLMSILDKNNIPVSKNQKLVAIAEDGTLIDNSREGVEVFKGDFSNQGNTEYLFLGSGHNGDMEKIEAVFKLDNDKLVRMDFDNIVKTNLKLNDISKFYFYMADPAAIVKDKKTYLRFMELPENFDKSKLVLCTYLWQGDKFSLIGPDNCIGGKNELARNDNNLKK